MVRLYDETTKGLVCSYRSSDDEAFDIEDGNNNGSGSDRWNEDNFLGSRTQEDRSQVLGHVRVKLSGLPKNQDIVHKVANTIECEILNHDDS